MDCNILLIVYLVTWCIYLTQMPLFTGDILEIGAQWAIAKKDIDAFERYMAQLKTYYLDYRYCEHSLLCFLYLNMLKRKETEISSGYIFLRFLCIIFYTMTFICVKYLQ